MILASRMQKFYEYFASIPFEYSLHIMYALKHDKHSTYTVAFSFLNETSCFFHAHVHTRTHSQRNSAHILEAIRANER